MTERIRGTGWLPVGTRQDVADAGAVRVAGPDGPIAVFDTPDGLFALGDTCPHGQASLCEGWVEDGTVECPAHLAVFSVRTGQVRSGPASAPATAYRVEVRGDTVGVVLDDSGSARPDERPTNRD
ncbi:non-heme iron oxygenase ferredoxin subunit [Nocardiopsis sp. FIRDI 009]|uniref:non-heme iron oxygenase ferredoxin subunit n=1 Tax=Nocardiopsis sp. FIRDI 009 TaxID=714197 RepID=UPI000E2299A9|nr:non-heme iron oxygenase ferredoxin subunit [Nocardiopsis sp. FIRDI 009]